LEFGSPKVPQFAEAMLFHHLDDLDSKMECMRAMVEHDRQNSGTFTTYSASLERSVLKKERYLDGPAQAEAASTPPVAAPVDPAPSVPALAAPVAAQAAAAPATPVRGLGLLASKLQEALRKE
jgi:3'-5' exoribonuclease